MNKFLCFLFLMFFPIVVFARCTESDLSRYKTLSSHIDSYYEFDGSNFNITFYNVSNEFNVINLTDNATYSSSSNVGEFVVNGVKTGSTINFAVYPKGECSNYRVLTTYVTVPYYNVYYSDPICSNNSSSLCSKWANTTMYSYDSFVAAVKSSKKDEAIEEVNPDIAVRKYGFFDFLGDYYIYILLLIIVGGSVSIYFLDKKSKFDFSLK